MLHDTVSCFYYKKAVEQNFPFTNSARKSAFVNGIGFSDWKDATRRFQSHNETELHISAVSAFEE